jgi:hypothetical protein
MPFTEEELQNALGYSKRTPEGEVITERDSVFAEDEVNFVEVYTLAGNHKSTNENGVPLCEDQTANSNNGYAKKIVTPNTTHLYIKMSKGRLINPMGPYANREIPAKIGNDSVWKWTKVSQNTFGFYLQFLKSRNPAFYLNAERENIHA